LFGIAQEGSAAMSGCDFADYSQAKPGTVRPAGNEWLENTLSLGDRYSWAVVRHLNS
jgi:hypothetical protein